MHPLTQIPWVPTPMPRFMGPGLLPAGDKYLPDYEEEFDTNLVIPDLPED